MPDKKQLKAGLTLASGSRRHSPHNRGSMAAGTWGGRWSRCICNQEGRSEQKVPEPSEAVPPSGDQVLIYPPMGNISHSNYNNPNLNFLL